METIFLGIIVPVIFGLLVTALPYILAGAVLLKLWQSHKGE